MKVKIFTTNSDSQGLESEVNKFLDSNIRVIKTEATQSYAESTSSYLISRTLYIYYEDLIDKPVTTTNEQPLFTKEELNLIKKHLENSFRGFLHVDFHEDLQKSISEKLGLIV